jgi:enoyl-[acyl-carrier-protein] reductase (NADH)
MGVGTYDKMIELFTEESAVKRPNTVEEVAAVAVLLASDGARNITGCLFPVDGGTMPY